MKMCQFSPLSKPVEAWLGIKCRISSFVIVFVSGWSIAFVLLQSIALVSETLLIHYVAVAELELLKAVIEV